MESKTDNFQSIERQYGVNPLEGFTPNAFQQVLINESELGNLSPEVVAKSVEVLKNEIGNQTDPKVVKDLTKKLENLQKVEARPKKEISFDLENKYSSLFGQVETMIESLDVDSKKLLLRNVYINENPKWHPERNSLVHIKIVTSRGIEFGDEDLIRTGLFHDIAKFDTVSLNNQGWPTSLGHDKAGANAAKSAGENDVVVFVCNNHMKIKGWSGESEGGTLNPSTKIDIFSESPGADLNEKAKNFYKLCVFSKMDNMAYNFDANKLKWDNPSFDKWDEECPLKDEFKKAEFVKVEVKKQEQSVTSQELKDMGASGPQMGQIIKAIAGLDRETALATAKKMLGITEKKWIRTFESFRKNKK